MSLRRQKKQLSAEWLTNARALHIAQGAKIADHRASEMKVAANVRIFQGVKHVAIVESFMIARCASSKTPSVSMAGRWASYSSVHV